MQMLLCCDAVHQLVPSNETVSVWLMSASHTMAHRCRSLCRRDNAVTV